MLNSITDVAASDAMEVLVAKRVVMAWISIEYTSTIWTNEWKNENMKKVVEWLVDWNDSCTHVGYDLLIFICLVEQKHGLNQIYQRNDRDRGWKFVILMYSFSSLLSSM